MKKGKEAVKFCKSKFKTNMHVENLNLKVII